MAVWWPKIFIGQVYITVLFIGDRRMWQFNKVNKYYAVQQSYIANTLPTGSNLLQWGKATSGHCKLCHNRDTTCHVLNGCKWPRTREDLPGGMTVCTAIDETTNSKSTIQ